MNDQQFTLLMEAVLMQGRALDRIATAMETLAADKQPANTSGKALYERSLAELPDFDWGSIGAEVLDEDKDGVSKVNYKGKYFWRRTQSSFGNDVWFSRSEGKDDNGKSLYSYLIIFRDNKKVKRLPSEVKDTIEEMPKPQPKPTPEPQPTATTPQPTPQPSKEQANQLNVVGLYPSHNGITMRVRLAANVEVNFVINWLKQRGATEPSQINPDLFKELLKAIALQGRHTYFMNLELATNSFDNFIGVRTAMGIPYENCVEDWIKSALENVPLKAKN